MKLRNPNYKVANKINEIMEEWYSNIVGIQRIISMLLPHTSKENIVDVMETQAK
jgi:hypothetical protein